MTLVMDKKRIQFDSWPRMLDVAFLCYITRAPVGLQISWVGEIFLDEIDLFRIFGVLK